MTQLSALAEVLRRSLGPSIGVGVADPRAPAPPLQLAEKLAAARMRDKRYREFAAGRAAARAAMTELNLPPAPIPMNPDRAPHWPEGLCGSISHSASAAIAIVASRTEVPSLGIDIEEDTPLEANLWPEVLTPRELEWVRRQPLSDRGQRAKEIFCAKEATHKLHNPLTRRMLGFDEVTIVLEAKKFQAQLPLDAHDLPEEITGQILRASGLVIAVLSGFHISLEHTQAEEVERTLPWYSF